MPVSQATLREILRGRHQQLGATRKLFRICARASFAHGTHRKHGRVAGPTPHIVVARFPHQRPFAGGGSHSPHRPQCCGRWLASEGAVVAGSPRAPYEPRRLSPCPGHVHVERSRSGDSLLSNMCHKNYHLQTSSSQHNRTSLRTRVPASNFKPARVAFSWSRARPSDRFAPTSSALPPVGVESTESAR